MVPVVVAWLAGVPGRAPKADVGHAGAPWVPASSPKVVHGFTAGLLKYIVTPTRLCYNPPVLDDPVRNILEGA